MHMGPDVAALAAASPIPDESLAGSGLVGLLAQGLADILGAVALMTRRLAGEERQIRCDAPVQALLFVLPPADVILLHLRTRLVRDGYSETDTQAYHCALDQHGLFP